MKIEEFLSDVKTWALQQSEIAAVILVGSHARGTAREDSDVDLVLLTDNTEFFLNSREFIDYFGVPLKTQKEDYGRLISLRVWYDSGIEVEYGITLPDWASEPLDAGTKSVLLDGYKVIMDRNGIFEKLLLL